MAYSLLDDPLISLRDSNTTQSCTLPEVFITLQQDQAESFEALQPHQQQPWYSFLVQLAAITASRGNSGKLPETLEEWRRAMIHVTDKQETPWHIVVEDVSQPAFMQSPIPEGSLDQAKYRADKETPDELDMLVTSKSHDVKRKRILRPRAEHWLYALLTLQTMEGFMGAGNYGIVRMNSGYGNRSFVGLSANLSWGARFKRDVSILLDQRDRLLESYRADGHALLWLQPWDGTRQTAIPLHECDPYFIEICRRVRFLEQNDQLICYYSNTKSQRVAAREELKGITQDPWSPVDREEGKALSIGKNGFTYELLQDIILGEKFEWPPAFQFQKEEKEGAYVIAQALARGQGTTEGFHYRIIPIPQKAARLFQDESQLQFMAKRARKRVERTSQVTRQIIFPAISQLLSAGESSRLDYNTIVPWISRFNRAIDHRFFDELWETVEKSEDQAAREWDKLLLKEAEQVQKQAERSLPVSDIRRLRAVSSARGVFYGKARSILSSAYHNGTEYTEAKPENHA